MVFEIIKLLIEIIISIIVLILGFKIDKMLKKYENRLWTNQKILEKRLQIYDDVIFMLNDIYCFHCYIGNWKELSPITIIEYKRKLDKIINSYAPLFTERLVERYNSFINEHYKTFTGWGNDATIKSLYRRRQEYNTTWESDWSSLFDCENINNDYDENYSINNKKEKYKMLMREFKNNLEIFKHGNYKDAETPNINFLK
jgi:hypothetical protein